MVYPIYSEMRNSCSLPSATPSASCFQEKRKSPSLRFFESSTSGLNSLTSPRSWEMFFWLLQSIHMLGVLEPIQNRLVIFWWVCYWWGMKRLLLMRASIFASVLTFSLSGFSYAQEGVKDKSPEQIEKERVELRNKRLKSVPIYTQGLTEMKKGAFTEAIKFFDEALKIDPTLVECLVDRGKCLSWTGKPKLALADLTKALVLKPNNPKALCNRGGVYAGQLRKFDLAIADFSKAIELNPKYADAYHFRASSYKAQVKYKLALVDYTMAIELAPKDSKHYLARADINQKMSKGTEAEADFTKAIELSPKNYMAFFFRGNFYDRQKKLDLALKDFSKVIELNPRVDRAFLRRADIYKRQKKHALQVADLDKVLALKPKLVHTHYDKGIALMALGKREEAIKSFNTVVKLSPRSKLAQQAMERIDAGSEQ